MKSGRYVVLSDKGSGPSGLTRIEFGLPPKTVVAYVAKEFDDLGEAEQFADANEATLGPLRVLDQQGNKVVYLSPAARPKQPFRPKPPWP